MNHTHLSLWWRFFRNGHFSRTSRVLLRLFGMHEDDVGTCTASSFLTRNQALKSVRQFNRLWSISRWTGAVTSHLVIVVTAIATNTTGVVIWKHTVPTPGGAAGVTGIIVCIFVRILGEGKEEKKMTFNFIHTCTVNQAREQNGGISTEFCFKVSMDRKVQVYNRNEPVHSQDLIFNSPYEFVIGSTNNPLIYFYSHHMSAWECVDNVKRNSVLVTHGS